MVKVGIKTIKLFGYHGFFEEETKIGGWFLYDVEISYNLEAETLNDNLKKVVDYGEIYEIVKRVNSTPKKLIETLAFGIKKELDTAFDKVATKVRVTKLAPPLGGDVEATFFEC